MTAFSDKVHELLGSPEQPVPEKVTRENERQELLHAKAESIAAWRNYINGAAPATNMDGTQLRELTEAVGGVGFVSEVLGLRPSDIERSIEHGATTFLTDKALRKFITAATMALDDPKNRR